MKPIFLAIPVAIVVIFVGLMVGLRLMTRPPATQQSATPSARGLVTLESIRDLLHKAADYDDCRVAVQQLNLYIDGGPEEKPRSLSKEELELLKNKDQFGLDDGELAEVNRITFTPLDGHHLELCLLLHEAVRSLRLEKLAPLDQTAAGFAWVTRQVQLRERTGDALPPDFVLRRGFGTALERAQVFLAVLQQLGIDGCMLAIPGKPGEPTLRYWLPGALINKQIYLFDTRLGLPLPGPKGQGIATLAQLRAQPDILRQLTVDDKAPYDVSQDQARQAEIHVACVLSALAPRMRYLQERLSGTDKVLLSVDPVALVQRFAAGVQSDPMKGVAVRVWNLPGDVSSPIRVLRNFVPEDEGGIDQTARREQWKRQLIPGDYFPRRFVTLNAEPRTRLQTAFAYAFIPFSTQAKLQRDFLLRWLPGLVQPQQQQQQQHGGAQKTSDLLQSDRMPRDLLLRGRFGEATSELVAMRDELQRQKKMLSAYRGLDEQIDNWCNQADIVFGALQEAQRQSQSSKQSADPDALQKARDAVEKLSSSDLSTMIVLYTQAAAAEPMSAEVTYSLALCKQEQAERLQARQARAPDKRSAEALRQSWDSAASWWVTFLENHASHPAAVSARFHLARTRQAAGKPGEAVAILEELSGKVSGLEKVACLYLAKQWKAR